MTQQEIDKKIFFIDSLLGIIKNVETPMLMYKEEKDIVKEALKLYRDKFVEQMYL